jgi:phage baseplate assembly protein W|tara:strand:+ start:32 stop:529 length:498 start_codon:yes stop_codon:yes gene_type:complete
MSVTRDANRKVYSFKSVGKSAELSKKLARSTPELPPVGVKTPLTLSETGKSFLEMHNNFPDQLHDNLLNLILTNHGERLGHPKFGANLAELTFEMQEEGGQSEAMTRISTAVRKYMPYVSLETFSPIVENFDNKDVAKIGIVVGYSIPKLFTKIRNIEVILYSAG